MISQSLFDPTRFPPFSNLPMKTASRVPPIFRPLFSDRKIIERYCFIAEIQSADHSSNEDGTYHTVLKARDYEDQDVIMACSFPTCEPMGLTAKQTLRPGKLGLDVSPSGSDDDENENAVNQEVQGVVLNDPARLKILELDMRTLITLNNIIREFTSDVGGQRCFGCGRRRGLGSLEYCEPCEFIGFCRDNQECHRKALHDNGHNGHCEVLTDRDMARLLRGEWDELNAFESVVIQLRNPAAIWL
ncbi:hypothetical protein BDW74DRAFT_174761 [Aspergillus multicolor]|uniref:uncharacterized protein n=1 Tax=Aspergillus multicolor TaxID=41759 RepID=UPI003CCD650F